jgi:2-polyprenyl-6-methoxyphenol hydroxylase-like FAD-dependent oxidoreductase
LWRGGRAVGVRYADRDGVEHNLYAKLVLGADGRRSPVAAAVGAFTPYRASRNGRGLVFRYGTDPKVDTRAGETIYQWRDGNSFGMVFPSAPRGKVLMLFMGPAEEVAHAKRDPDDYWATKLAQHPGMAERVEGMSEMTHLRSTADTSAYFRASSGPGWALLGDAGHFKDPVVAQGQRDALWTGRAVAEATADKLDNPAALDLALRRWEHERDMECLHAYHFGNLETEIRPVSPVLIEILRRASRSQVPDASDLFGRARTMPQVITLPRMAAGLAAAVRRGTGGQPAGTLVREAFDELRVHLRVRRELRGKYFRSSRPIAGSDRPDPKPPAYRPASSPAPAAGTTTTKNEAVTV